MYQYKCPFCGTIWRVSGHQAGFVKQRFYDHRAKCADRTPDQRIAWIRRSRRGYDPRRRSSIIIFPSIPSDNDLLSDGLEEK